MNWRPFRSPEDPLPTSLGPSLSRLMADWGGGDVEDLSKVFGRWEECVGVRVAAHSRPLSLRQGVLVVAVDQPAWATQLKLLAAGLVKRLEEHCGKAVVSELRIRVERRSPGEQSADV